MASYDGTYRQWDSAFGSNGVRETGNLTSTCRVAPLRHRLFVNINPHVASYDSVWKALHALSALPTQGLLGSPDRP